MVVQYKYYSTIFLGACCFFYEEWPGLLEWLVKGHQARCPVYMSTASYGYCDDVTVEVDYTMCNPCNHAAKGAHPNYYWKN